MRDFGRDWFFWLLITRCVYPEKHQMSGQCESLAIFHFTHSTDVRSKSKSAFQAKMTCSFRSQKTILRLFGEKNG